MNPKWPLWIAASINKHFSDNLSSHKLFFEGQHHDDSLNIANTVEIRFDGPYFWQLGSNLWRLNYEINILIQSQFNEKNNYIIWNLIGDVSNAMSKIIKLYTYEIGVSPVFFACLMRKSGKFGRDDIVVHYFGQIEPNLKKQQASVEAHYETDLEI